MTQHPPTPTPQTNSFIAQHNNNTSWQWNSAGFHFLATTTTNSDVWQEFHTWLNRLLNFQRYAIINIFINQYTFDTYGSFPSMRTLFILATGWRDQEESFRMSRLPLLDFLAFPPAFCTALAAGWAADWVPLPVVFFPLLFAPGLEDCWVFLEAKGIASVDRSLHNFGW